MSLDIPLNAQDRFEPHPLDVGHWTHEGGAHPRPRNDAEELRQWRELFGQWGDCPFAAHAHCVGVETLKDMAMDAQDKLEQEINRFRRWKEEREGALENLKKRSREKDGIIATLERQLAAKAKAEPQPIPAKMSNEDRFLQEQIAEFREIYNRLKADPSLKLFRIAPTPTHAALFEKWLISQGLKRPKAPKKSQKFYQKRNENMDT